MPACAHCGAAFEPHDGLFCRWCGRAGELAVPRLAEAVTIETAGDIATAIVPYGAALPTSFSEVFTTAEDDQPTVMVRLVVGNSPRASACRPLMTVTLALRRPGPRGVPRVRLTLTIEADGRGRVLAEEEGQADNRLVFADLRLAAAQPRGQP
ncbi:Hsp70 family protein [Nannocystis pusilla]|uniref:Hsp70 family protein n=1 Tax=Nannocystis pusilla TaxID=889268 RepID=A0ABS7TNX5_9BACT|nr:Hsp70 family protein [Nannocystis pusilla]MBZ5709942.1 Hsp70 family protein [Nannocystis pusilla]